MSEDKQVIGLLPGDGPKGGAKKAQVLVRLADGRMAIENIAPEARKLCRSFARFRPGRPIRDPATREVIGYEMEQVSMAASA